MTERKMARVVKIDAISPIEGADAIEVATIGGWKVVVKKGEFEVNSLACYAEVDSWIPHSIAPFLTKPGQFPKVYNEVEGQRLRTIKLRGQISQGLLLPLDVAIEKFYSSDEDEGQELCERFFEGSDLTELLSVQKWEPPAEFRAANAKSSFPHFIPKTDCERAQNLSHELEKWTEEGVLWQCTEKLDGSSMTAFIKDGEVGVCSRNLELKDDGSTTFWEVAKSQKLIEALQEMQGNFALQGELLGGSIQGNAYKIDGFKFYLYDIFDIDNQKYLSPGEVEYLANKFRIQHVPILGHTPIAKADGKTAVETLLEAAEGKSQVGVKPNREGFVLKHPTDTSISVKCISNAWLLKNEG